MTTTSNELLTATPLESTNPKVEQKNLEKAQAQRQLSKKCWNEHDLQALSTGEHSGVDPSSLPGFRSGSEVASTAGIDANSFDLGKAALGNPLEITNAETEQGSGGAGAAKDQALQAPAANQAEPGSRLDMQPAQYGDQVLPQTSQQSAQNSSESLSQLVEGLLSQLGLAGGSGSDSSQTSPPEAPTSDNPESISAQANVAKTQQSEVAPQESSQPAAHTATNSTTDSTSTKDSTTNTDNTSSSSTTQPQGAGSTATKFGTAAQPTVDQSAPGFYVSANGSADGTGTKEDPFATLQQAQQAMQNSDIKTTYVEGGTYKMGSTLNLTSADSGESFVSVGGASNPAVLDGGGKLSNLISLNGADNVNIEGFSMENTSNSPAWSSTQHGQVQSNVGAIYAENSTGDTFAYNDMNNVNVGVNMKGDSNERVAQNSITNAQSAIDSGSTTNGVYGSNNTIQGNNVDDITGYGSKLFDNVGAINIAGDTNVTINNNVINNTAGVGIQMNYRENGSGFTVSNNTINNTDDVATTAKADTSSNPVGDDGGIHIITQPGSTKDLNGLVSDNYVTNSGVNRADKCIYLDDGVNGVTVSGNVMDEGGAGDAMQIHGGSNNTVENNTMYLGNGEGILYQSDGYAMTGNTIEDNNFIKDGTGTKAYQMQDKLGTTPTFSGNTYSSGIDSAPDNHGTTSTRQDSQSPTNTDSSENTGTAGQDAPGQNTSNQDASSSQSPETVIEELVQLLESIA